MWFLKLSDKLRYWKCKLRFNFHTLKKKNNNNNNRQTEPMQTYFLLKINYFELFCELKMEKHTYCQTTSFYYISWMSLNILMIQWTTCIAREDICTVNDKYAWVWKLRNCKKMMSTLELPGVKTSNLYEFKRSLQLRTLLN